MPLVPDLLRRRERTSDADLRRRSYFPPQADQALNNGPITERASEQIPRRMSVVEFLSSPLSSTTSNPPEITMTAAEGDVHAGQRPGSPPIQEQTPKHHRFSMLKFRHASDSHLSTRARLQAVAPGIPPPLPNAPEIITTSPTIDAQTMRLSKKRSKAKLGRTKIGTDASNEGSTTNLSTTDKSEGSKPASDTALSSTRGRVTFDEPSRPLPHTTNTSPPAYGDELNSTLALPVNRLSESSRSDGSSGEHGVYATTTTTTHTVHTTTTFFRLPRRKKHAPLFDLSHLPQKSALHDNATPPRLSVASSNQSRGTLSPPRNGSRASLAHGYESDLPPPVPSPSRSIPGSPSKPAPATHAPLVRNSSNTSNKSFSSRPSMVRRGRASTMNSIRNSTIEDHHPPTLTSGRTSTSTGRKSFGDLFGLSHRLMQNQESMNRSSSGLATPGSSTSKNNSMQLAREPTPVVLPERYDDDTPAKYLVRLEEVVSRGVVASVLCKGTDPFIQSVLRSYMRSFGFFGDPMDMAIRKLLMEVELPKETQQIDRCLQGFANRYHECNPGVYASPDQAYFIAFSLLILHTDVFNKNNKYKMQKADYLKNTHGEGIFDEILECFYDNISYTPFIHVEDDLDLHGERIIQHKPKRKLLFPRAVVESPKLASKDPVDPYTLIIDRKLDTLRPNLKDVMRLEEHYSYLGTAPSLNLRDLQKTFFRTGVLQIVSARSRPDAFMSEKTVTNPDEAQAGIVDIKITKVGLLWRKDIKKKKTRSPWQEWGAILTGAQLYFFRNTNWIKNLMHQHETHIKQGHDGIPVTFKPPLDQFKPDALMSMDDAVALMDSSYKKHKNAFFFVRHGGFEETFLADNEEEMNDWLAKLNYAAAFRTSGVRMRGVVGGNYDGQRTRGIRRLQSDSDATKSIQTPTGEVTIVSGKIDLKMAQDILSARREIMIQKIAEAEARLAVAEKQLDDQLRNARHLQILAPIQNKTRVQVVLAAGRMAAQLKWGRMEIWRLRCHRDILKMDLDEEGGDGLDNPAGSAVNVSNPEKAPLTKEQSKSSTVAPPRSPNTQTSLRPESMSQKSINQEDSERIKAESALEAEIAFQAPPQNQSTTSFHKAQASWDLPPLTFDHQMRQQSFGSNMPPSPSPRPLMPPSRVGSGTSQTMGELYKRRSSVKDTTEIAAPETGSIDKDKTSDAKRPGTGPTEDSKETEKDKLDVNKIRRSLHRTLRESHIPTHTRSRKGKDSNSSAGMSDEGKEDVLTRSTGSFTVHGKKASVITFGTELQSMSREERLRLRRQSAISGDANATSPGNLQEDFQSLLSEPIVFHNRAGSATSASTATAKSFHDRLSIQGPNGVSLSLDGDDENEVAIVASDGARTPLSRADDDNASVISAPGSQSNQAAFYTPEAANSPVSATFEARLHTPSSVEHEEGSTQNEKSTTESISGSLLQTVVGA